MRQIERDRIVGVQGRLKGIKSALPNATRREDRRILEDAITEVLVWLDIVLEDPPEE